MTSEEKEPRELTSGEEAALSRRLLEVAFSTLGEFTEEIGEDVNQVAQRVILSLVNVDDERDRQVRSFAAKGARVSVYDGDLPHIVASAFYCWHSNGEKKLDDVSPHCYAGALYLGFAQGMAAAQLMSEALFVLEEGEEFAFAPRGARQLWFREAMRSGSMTSDGEEC
jgi:hypothetical protein